MIAIKITDIYVITLGSHIQQFQKFDPILFRFAIIKMSLQETKLPPDVRNLIILQLSYPDIIHLYQTAPLYGYITQAENLWELLLERDFPQMKNYFTQFPFADESNYTRYKILYHEIDRRTRKSIKKYNFANFRYINQKAMYDDVFEFFYKIAVKGYKNELNNDQISVESIKLLTILSGLNAEYVGYGKIDFSKLSSVDLDVANDIVISENQ